MSKFPVVKTRSLVKYLQKKGFQPDKNAEGKGSHLFLKNSETGKWTTLQLNIKEYSAKMIKTVLEQTGISREEFMSDFNSGKVK